MILLAHDPTMSLDLQSMLWVSIGLPFSKSRLITMPGLTRMCKGTPARSLHSLQLSTSKFNVPNLIVYTHHSLDHSHHLESQLVKAAVTVSVCSHACKGLEDRRARGRTRMCTTHNGSSSDCLTCSDAGGDEWRWGGTSAHDASLWHEGGRDASNKKFLVIEIRIKTCS